MFLFKLGRLVTFAAMLFLMSGSLRAQTSLTGTFSINGAAVANGSLHFLLQNCGGAPGAGSASYTFTLSSSGGLTGAVQPNATNSCQLLGGVNVSYFQVALLDSANNLLFRRYYQIPVSGSAFNLATATALTALPQPLSVSSTSSVSFGTTAGTATVGNDARILDALKMQGSWLAGTAYSQNDVVVLPTGSSYYSVWPGLNSNTNNAPASSPAYWKLLGGTVSPTFVRNNATIGFTAVSSVTIPWLNGVQAGDLVVIAIAGGYNGNALSAIPSGWSAYGRDPGGFASGVVLSKVLGSADITAGSVTVNFDTSTYGAYSIVNLVGSAGTIREVDASRTGLFISPVTLTTSSAVLASDVAIYFGANGSNTLTGGIAPTINQGTLQNTYSGGTGSVGAALYIAASSPAGVSNTVFTYPQVGPYTYQAVVIVEGATLGPVAMGEVPTGSGVFFTLSYPPLASTLLLELNGLVLSPSASSYSISGTNITLSRALTLGDTLYAHYYH